MQLNVITKNTDLPSKKVNSPISSRATTEQKYSFGQFLKNPSKPLFSGVLPKLDSFPRPRSRGRSEEDHVCFTNENANYKPRYKTPGRIPGLNPSINGILSPRGNHNKNEEIDYISSSTAALLSPKYLRRPMFSFNNNKVRQISTIRQRTKNASSTNLVHKLHDSGLIDPVAFCVGK